MLSTSISATFSTVSHNILIGKLRRGVRWIENRLNSRLQKATISGMGSSWRFSNGPSMVYSFINCLDKGAEAASAISLMTQSQEEWLISQTAELHFRGSVGKEKQSEIQER